MSLFRFTRTSQPQSPVGIDWANPNTKNLFFACDRFGQNYAGRINHLGFSGTRTDRATPKGVGRGGGGTGYFTGPAERSLVAPKDAAFSIVGTFALGATGQTNKYLAYDYLDVTSQAAVIFGYVANTLEFYCDSFTGTNPRTGSGIVVNDTSPHTFGYSYDGTNWIGYLDGVRVFSTTRTFSCNMPTGAFTTSLLSAGGGNTLNASILQWTTFDKGIGEERLKSLTANPWQIWLPTNRAIYPVAAGGGAGNATGSLASITIDAATGTATGKATATATPANVSITAPTATATGGAVGNATGALSGVTLAGPSATASGKAQATTTPASVTLVSPTATATGKGQATGALAAVSLVAPTGTASASSSGTGNAIASPASITIAAPSATATGAAAAFAAFMSVVLTPVSGTASSGVIQVAGAITRDRRTQESSRPHSVSTSRPGRIANTTR